MDLISSDAVVLPFRLSSSPADRAHRDETRRRDLAIHLDVATEPELPNAWSVRSTAVAESEGTTPTSSEALPAALEPRRRSQVINRVVNVLLATVALTILSPVIILIALAVKLSSRGPVLYTQTRVGIDRRRRRADALFCRRAADTGGIVFTIYKFRSMYVDAENGVEVWATQDDPRVTPVGRVLRKMRMDELPQLLNVLKGDMNIVGPRPERPSIFAQLRENITEYPLRQRTKPGLTGWAQVNHSYDTTIEDVRTKVRYDLEYLQRQSLAEDVKIMLKTVPVVLFRRGGW